MADRYRRVLAASDMVMLTSDNEGMPLSLIQAGMAGLPVVATDVGSVSEVVLDGVTGILAELETSKIADALERLFYDKKLRDAMGKEAREHTLAHFSVHRLVRDHENLYKSLITNRAMS